MEGLHEKPAEKASVTISQVWAKVVAYNKACKDKGMPSLKLLKKDCHKNAYPVLLERYDRCQKIIAMQPKHLGDDAVLHQCDMQKFIVKIIEDLNEINKENYRRPKRDQQCPKIVIKIGSIDR